MPHPLPLTLYSIFMPFRMQLSFNLNGFLWQTYGSIRNFHWSAPKPEEESVRGENS